MFKIQNLKRFIIIILALLVNFLIWAYLYFIVQPTAESYTLHYNIYFGIDQIGSGIKLYLMPLFGLIVIGFNSLISLSKMATKRLAMYVDISSLVVQLLLITSLILLIINHY
jgi:hypothetical protein